MFYKFTFSMNGVRGNTAYGSREKGRKSRKVTRRKPKSPKK